MATPLPQQSFLLFLFLLLLALSPLAQCAAVAGGVTSWCVARSDATFQALQTALDYACASGADCSPLQTNGLCFLPNSIQAHASYAFNSFYQRKSMAPGSCDFSGTATVAKSDPSYGSCVYPASLSAAGGASGTPTTQTTPTSTVPFSPTMPTGTTPLSGSTGFNSAGLSPPGSDSDSSIASMDLKTSKIMWTIAFLLVFSFIS